MASTTAPAPVTTDGTEATPAADGDVRRPPVPPGAKPCDEEISREGGTVVVWLPVALLVIAWSVGRVAAGHWLDLDGLHWALLPTGGLLVLRFVLEKRAAVSVPGSRDLEALYGLHVALVAVAVVFNPMTCIYAFVGYIDGPRFLTGRAVHLVLVATALVSAVGQIGGVIGVVTSPIFFALLALVNLLLAGTMMYVSEERDRTIEERERAVAELDRANRANAALHDQLMTRARESGAAEERARLSREIHDTVAQGLVGVIRQLEAVGEDIAPDSRHRVTVAEEAARDSLLEARRAIEALGPHQLQGTDVVEALGQLVASWARTHRVVATFDADDAPPAGANAAVLVRITQEALANVARHAGAGAVTVTLAGSEDEHHLEITDDGSGFDPQADRRGHGLGNMRTRITDAGGRLQVTSAPGQGTTVAVSVPR